MGKIAEDERNELGGVELRPRVVEVSKKEIKKLLRGERWSKIMS